jgi:DNA polymerase III sliding clamp (beta) subunit (PCNA family)
MGALKLAGIFGSKSGEVRLKAQENKKAVEIVSADQALGENAYVLPAKVQGQPKAITFNWRYIMDALKTMKGEEVFLGLNGDAEEDPDLHTLLIRVVVIF